MVADLDTVLDETRIVIEPSLREAGIEVIWDVSPGLPLVQADHHSLLQVFVNLARNSQQALENCERREVRIAASLESDLVVVRFRDSGPGVPIPRNCSGPSSRARTLSDSDCISRARSCAPTAADCAMSRSLRLLFCRGALARGKPSGNMNERKAEIRFASCWSTTMRCFAKASRRRSPSDRALARRALRQHSRRAALLAQHPFDLVLLDHDLGAERASQFLPAARQAGFEGRVLS